MSPILSASMRLLLSTPTPPTIGLPTSIFIFQKEKSVREEPFQFGHVSQILLNSRAELPRASAPSQPFARPHTRARVSYQEGDLEVQVGCSEEVVDPGQAEADRLKRKDSFQWVSIDLVLRQIIISNLLKSGKLEDWGHLDHSVWGFPAKPSEFVRLKATPVQSPAYPSSKDVSVHSANIWPWLHPLNKLFRYFAVEKSCDEGHRLVLANDRGATSSQHVFRLVQVHALGMQQRQHLPKPSASTPTHGCH